MRVTWIAGLAAAALCAVPASAETVYRRGIERAPETFDPQKAGTMVETNILLDLFEGLVAFDGLGRTVPGAAESWTVSPDGLVYTFTLRKEARWSNGEPVKAADFVASFRRLFSPDTGATEADPLAVIANAAAVQSGVVKPDELGVRASDAATLEITLEKPTPTFLMRLAAPAALPIHPGSLKRYGKNFSAPGNLVSNGAFRLGGVDKAGQITLLKNARFRAAKSVALDSVVYKPFDAAADCVTAFRAGEVQTCGDVPVERLADLKAEFGPALRVAPYLGTYYYAVKTDKKPFDDPRVRRALSLVVDQDGLAKESWSGGMLAATSFVPPELVDAPPAAKAPLAARQAEARALIGDAGFSAAKPLRLVIRVGTGAAHEETARAVAAMWKAVGIEATVATESNAAHFARLRDGGDFDVARAGWIADEPDALDFLALLRGDNKRFNYARYANRGYDRLLEAAGTAGDPAKRRELLGDAEAVVERDAPVIPLLRYASLALVSPKLAGWHDNPQNLHPARFLSLAK